MVKAVWKDRVIAESEQVQVVDGHVDFPIASVQPDLLEPSDRRSVCRKSVPRTASMSRRRAGVLP